MNAKDVRVVVKLVCPKCRGGGFVRGTKWTCGVCRGGGLVEGSDRALTLGELKALLEEGAQ